MTGFGYSEITETTFHLSVELKSYNHRYLDLNISLPAGLSPLEPRIRDFLSGRIRRGRIELYVKLRVLEEDLEARIDRRAVSAYLAALNELCRVTGIEDSIKLDHILAMPGVIKEERQQDFEKFWTVLEPVLNTVFNEYDTLRKREGEATCRDILSQIKRIRTLAATIADHAETLETRIRANLRERFAQVMGDAVDENRVLAETAVLLARFSINEEIIRLGAHLDVFEKTAAEDDAAGKKLDFICQEIGREINTIASKSVVTEINHSVIAGKDALENIREQLRNVE